MWLSGRLGWAADRQLALATGMAEELAATGRPADAAALYAEYASDAEAAVAHLLQAHAWREALRTAYRCSAVSAMPRCCCRTRSCFMSQLSMQLLYDRPITKFCA
jgi:hypothetical protein